MTLDKKINFLNLNCCAIKIIKLSAPFGEAEDEFDRRDLFFSWQTTKVFEIKFHLILNILFIFT